MALLNPINAFIVPFLFVVTVPLAIFAGITTMVAFAILSLRVIVVYLDIVLSLLPQYLIGIRAPSYRNKGYVSTASRSPSPTTVPLRRRRRRLSSASAVSIGSAGDSSLWVMPSVGADRDFEGLGGWRVGEDETWTAINSRSELPDRRHHQRSVSGGTTPGEGGYLMMKARTRSPVDKATGRKSASPNSSRARTPSASRMAAGKMHEGYFPLRGAPTKG